MTTLPHAPLAAREWRRTLRDVLAAAGVPADRVDDVLLVASELAGNAVLHARPLPEGCLLGGCERAGDRLRLVLVDGGSRSGSHPRPREIDLARPTGRGLAIVEQLAAEWGVDEAPGRTSVWAEISLVG